MDALLTWAEVWAEGLLDFEADLEPEFLQVLMELVLVFLGQSVWSHHKLLPLDQVSALFLQRLVYLD